MNLSKRWNLVLVIGLCGVVAIVSSVMSASKVEANATQDVNSLDRRISMLEQRFYALDSSLNRLQQYMASQRPVTTTTQPSISERELLVLREEVQRLSVRLGEVECGVVKLDERTVNPNRRGGRSTDPCRLSPDAPLRLPTRP